MLKDMPWSYFAKQASHNWPFKKNCLKKKALSLNAFDSDEQYSFDKNMQINISWRCGFRGVVDSTP